MIPNDDHYYYRLFTDEDQEEAIRLKSSSIAIKQDQVNVGWFQFTRVVQ